MSLRLCSGFECRRFRIANKSYVDYNLRISTSRFGNELLLKQELKVERLFAAWILEQLTTEDIVTAIRSISVEMSK